LKKRSFPLSKKDSTVGEFGNEIDVFGDKSMKVIILEGHCIGHIGLFIPTTLSFSGYNGIFLLGDACWNSITLEEMRMPHFLTLIVHSNWELYHVTVKKLREIHQKNPKILMVPSHCKTISQNFVNNNSKL